MSVGPAVQHTGARPSLSDVQALRGVAALSVMCYHTGTIFSQYFNDVLFGNVFRAGFLGVDFFFVLSGFVMYWAHAQDFGQPGALLPFVKKRLLRILPVYWFVLLLKLARDWRTLDGLVVVCAALLIPYPRPPYITVSWTLSYELFFYAAVGLMILLPRGWLSILPLMGLLGFALVPAPEVGGGGGFAETLALFPFNIHLLEFLMGMAVGWWHARSTGSLARAHVLVLGASLCLLASFGVATWMAVSLADQGWRHAYDVAEVQSNVMFDHAVWLFAAPFSVLLLGLVQREHHGGRPLLPWLNGLGDMSYSLYLVHGFVIFGLLGRPQVQGWIGQHQAAVLGVMAAAVALASVVHRLVEKPLTAWLRRKLL